MISVSESWGSAARREDVSQRAAGPPAARLVELPWLCRPYESLENDVLQLVGAAWMNPMSEGAMRGGVPGLLTRQQQGKGKSKDTVGRVGWHRPGCHDTIPSL